MNDCRGYQFFNVKTETSDGSNNRNRNRNRGLTA